MAKSEFEIVSEFSHMLGLPSKTDGTLFIYKSHGSGKAAKPDGYYYYEGITFILDAKAEGQKFSGQLEDYMDLESNENFIGFKYNGVDFECYVNGELKEEEIFVRDKDYYKEKYFNNKINNENIVNKSARKLADLFRDSDIDKQMNVPFIGAVMLCIKYEHDIDLSSTATILRSLEVGMNAIITDKDPLTKKQKREFIKKALSDSTLKKAKTIDLLHILSEISIVYSFINISVNDYKGHDIMNSFLRVFRKWNSANAKEKGEVFTPDHIAQLMYRITRCSKDNVILDPTCGSGTFLTNAMMTMWSETVDIEEQKVIRENKIIGIENNEFNATLAGMNMMLHGDGSSNIFYENCFEKLPNLRNLYDRVLMNPPFSKRDKELKFVLQTLECMEEGGLLSTILPKSCVRGTDKKNTEYLQKIFRFNKLLAVVSLPNDLFIPNAAPATCIMLFKKDVEGHSGETLLVDCSDDGLVLKREGDVSSRIDVYDKWQNIQIEIISAFEGKPYIEYRAIKKTLTLADELLFEAYSSHRPVDIAKDVFARYLRESIAAKLLCGKILEPKVLDQSVFEPYAYKRYPISALIEKIEKGKDKSIDRKLEDKYDLNGVPLIIAKKDNNGIGGMLLNPRKIYKDKICVVSGGDGGGGKTYYCDFEFAATSFIMVCDLVSGYRNIADTYAKFYLSVVISERLYKTIGHGRTIRDLSDLEVKLPVKANSEPDFAYMSAFIKQLPYATLL